MLWINKWETICATSGIGVWAEQLVSYLQWNSIDVTHIALDTVTHWLLNTLHIHFHGLEKYCWKKWSRIVEASIDALVHMIWKYWIHHLIHYIEHQNRSIEKVATFGMQHMKNIHDQNTCSVSMITLPIFACLIAEQVYKNFIDKKFHK